MIVVNEENDKFRQHLENAQDVIENGDLSPALIATRADVYEAVSYNFEFSVDPNGVRWQERKRKYPWPILIKTGRMRAAAIGESSESINRIEQRQMELGVAPSVFYAGIHNYGTPKMPQREFMGANEEYLGVMDDRLAGEIYKIAFGD